MTILDVLLNFDIFGSLWCLTLMYTQHEIMFYEGFTTPEHKLIIYFFAHA